MPFKSKAQQRKCYALKGKGQAGSWDCDESSEKTNFKKIPERKKKKKVVKKASISLAYQIGYELAGSKYGL